MPIYLLIHKFSKIYQMSTLPPSANQNAKY